MRFVTQQIDVEKREAHCRKFINLFTNGKQSSVNWQQANLGEMITWWRLSSRPDRIICCVFNWPVIVAARVATWRGAGGAVGVVGEGKCPSAASGNSPQWASFYAAPVQPPSLHYNLYPLHPILLPLPRAQNARSVLFCGPKDGVNSFAVFQWPTLFQLQYRIFYSVPEKRVGFIS